MRPQIATSVYLSPLPIFWLVPAAVCTHNAGSLPLARSRTNGPRPGPDVRFFFVSVEQPLKVSKRLTEEPTRNV